MVLQIGFKPLKTEPANGVKFVSAGLAASCADIITFPLDTAKVRLQIQGEGKTNIVNLESMKTQKYRGLVGTLLTIIREEGPRGMYKGLVAGLQRQMCFASVRIGLYDSMKTFYTKQLGLNVGNKSKLNDIFIRVSAGATTGSMAVLFAQPTDVVKIRLQGQIPGKPIRYKRTMLAYGQIYRAEGIRNGLWRGLTPNVMRNVVVNCCELVCYDYVKESILRKKLMSDNLPCHFVSAFMAGFFTTCVASPVDVIKTRYMNSATGQYTGVCDCAMKMFRMEGAFAFYKGFVPSFMRLGSWNVFMFVLFEQYKRGIGAHYASIE